MLKIKKLAGRCLALLLASAFLFSEGSPLLGTVAHAATGDNTPKLRLSWVNGDKTTGEVIRGEEIEARGDNVKGYAPKGSDAGALTFYETPDIIKDGLFKIVPPDRKDNYEIYQITSLITPETEAEALDKAEVSYTIRTNYNSLVTVGNAVDGSSSGDFVAINPEELAISQDSVFYLEYNKGTFKWKLPGDKKIAGYFVRWETKTGKDSDDAYERSNDGDTCKQRYTDKFPTYRLDIAGEYYDFTPGTTYKKYVTDDGKYLDQKPDETSNIKYTEQTFKGLDPDGSGNYTITFYERGSNEIFLNVIGRLYARNLVADQAAKITNNQFNPDFIKVQDKNNPKNIFHDFSLTTDYSYKNTAFTLEWEWKPKNPDDAKVVNIKRSFFGTTGEQEVVVTPQENDVEGELQVKVNFTNPRPESKSDQNKDAVTRTIPIIIRGTGTSGYVDEIRYTIGESGTETRIDVKNNGMPKDTFLMDIYQGGVYGYEKQPVGPDTLEFSIYAGEGNGEVIGLLVTSSDPEALEANIRNTDGTVTPYSMGSDFTSDYKSDRVYQNKDTSHPITLMVKAKTKDALTTLNFYYFVAMKGGDPIVDPYAKKQSMTIKVEDNSPEDTVKLSKLEIHPSDNVREEFEGYTFSPETTSYELTIPYKKEGISLRPAVWDYKMNQIIGVNVQVYGLDGNLQEAQDDVWLDKSSFDMEWYDDPGIKVDGKPSIRSDKTMKLALAPGQTIRVTYTVRAQNPNITNQYVLDIKRNPPSDDSTLKSLVFVADDKDGTEYAVALSPDTLEYELHIPYRIHLLQVKAELAAGAEFTKWDPELKGKTPISLGNKNWLHLFEGVQSEDMDMYFEIDTIAENERDTSKYMIHIIRDDPSNDSSASLIEVLDGNKADSNVLALDPAFGGEMEDENSAYTVRVPYVTDKVYLRVTPGYEYATIRAEYDKRISIGSSGASMPLTAGAISKGIEVPVMSDTAPYYEILVIVTAENGTETTYRLHIERAEPDKDAHLAGLELKDLAGELQSFDDPFNPDVLSYTATVLYATDKVTITPTPSSATATVRVNGRKVENGQPSQNIRLDYPGYNDIVVEVTAQDGETVITYKVRVKRADPSSDCRLRALEVSDVDRLKPVFSPKTLHYTANVNEGVTEVIVTATVNDPFASLQIDGKDAVSGQPSAPIPLLDVYQTVTVVVTAQDGKSSATYEVVLYNPNMVEKSSNADLADLKVIEGQMEPGFAPSVLTYEVYVKEDLNSVEIIPTPADPMAKVQVFFGTLEIGDEEGNYEYAIADGENVFSVRVTAPDGSKYKDYTITVYRNEEGKMGFLKPITAEDIDFENSGDIILVDITKYPRVAADVFNTLKTEYPEKTIIFEGNDYSLQFDGADIEKIIPHTEVFDFSLSFDSPHRSEIMKKIRRYSANDDARIVLVHFGDNKELPAPARFTLSLGQKYGDEQLYWHYWNQERERIDYYGTVDTNSKGTFAVKLERLGDYIVADQRLAGSEDKSTENLTKDTSLLKTNPNTGNREGEQ